MKIAVLGAGAWGTALALAAAARHDVTLWARDPAQVAAMRAERENRRYLPGVALPANLALESDLAKATAGAGLAILASPVAGLRPLLEACRKAAPWLPFVWVCKGLEKDSGLLPHQVVIETMGPVTCGVLTGPSFADELARGLPTAVTLAATDADFAGFAGDALHGGPLRVYVGDDVVGAEIGGAVKNVLAIATGICDGLALGMNARAALITRGLAEIMRFGEALGARRETLTGLAGLGDLILTCTGDLSRNRRVGLALAAGKDLATIAAELGHVAEGVPAAREVARRAAELGIEMPISQAVAAVVDGRLPPQAAVERLMAREQTRE